MIEGDPSSRNHSNEYYLRKAYALAGVTDIGALSNYDDEADEKLVNSGRWDYADPKLITPFCGPGASRRGDYILTYRIPPRDVSQLTQIN